MRRAFQRPVVSMLLVLGLAACGQQGGAPQAATPDPAAKARPKGTGTVQAQMRGVHFRIDPQVVLEVRHLRGALEPTRDGKPPWFDDPTSFDLHIDDAEVAMTAASLQARMSHYLFAGPNAPVRDVVVEIHDGHLFQTSTLNKKIPLRATLEGEVSATPDGKIRFHPTKITAGKLSVKKLMDVFGVEISDMIKSQEAKGLKVVEDDLILDPERLLPPPHMRGRVVAVRIEGDRMVQVFGRGEKGEPLKPSFPDAKNYMFFHGGILSFGKLTMHGADLQLVDADPKDPFDFFLKQLDRQLTAGYSKTMPDKGLVSYMPDSNETDKQIP